MSTQAYNKPVALVSGASMGIGLEMAKQLVMRGYNLVLVALPGEHLKTTAHELEKQFGADVLPIEADISTRAGCESIFIVLAEKNIHLSGLINNAGMGYVEEFKSGNLNLYEKVVDLNIKSVITMTRLFVDQRKQGCKTWILNVGSLGGYFPLPRKSVYSGSKSFVINFSRALEIELAPLNIQVSVLCPGTVNTNHRIRANNKAASWIGRQSVMEADVVARFAIRKLLHGKRIIVPGLLNKLFLLVGKLVPDTIERIILHATFKRIHAKTPHHISIGFGNEDAVGTGSG